MKLFENFAFSELSEEAAQKCAEAILQGFVNDAGKEGEDD